MGDIYDPPGGVEHRLNTRSMCAWLPIESKLKGRAAVD